MALGNFSVGNGYRRIEDKWIYKLIFKGIADKPYGLVRRGWGADLFYRFHV